MYITLLYFSKIFVSLKYDYFCVFPVTTFNLISIVECDVKDERLNGCGSKDLELARRYKYKFRKSIFLIHKLIKLLIMSILYNQVSD